MNQSPRFSVIIATYNRCDYVLEAIASVREQTFAPHEIIVVTDGGTDETAARIRETFPEIVLIEQPNLGRSVARNTGIAHATGEWICFLDDDDLWHREKLQATANYLRENPDCRALNNPVWYFATSENDENGYFGFERDFVARNLEECHKRVQDGDNSRNSTEFLQIKDDSFRLMLERARGLLSSTVVRRDILLRAGAFPPMQSHGEDWTMFVNVARLAQWHTLPARYGFTRLHSQQSNADLESTIYILAGQINAWFCGRAFPHNIGGLENTRRELRKYGAVYRVHIQNYGWSALRNRQWKTAYLVWSLGKLLLPRARDRFYALTPPPITWRFERYVLGRHRK